MMKREFESMALLVLLAGAWAQTSAAAPAVAAPTVAAPGAGLRDASTAEALKRKSTRPCETLKKKFPVIYEQCVSSVALDLGKPDLCDELRDDPFGWAESRCVGPIARIRDDKSICERIKSKAGKDGNCARPFDRMHKWRATFKTQKVQSWVGHIGTPGFPPVRQADCLALGGRWIGSALPSAESCQFKTTDSSRKCRDASECQADFCVGSDVSGMQGKHFGMCAKTFPPPRAARSRCFRGLPSSILV